MGSLVTTKSSLTRFVFGSFCFMAGQLCHRDINNKQEGRGGPILLRPSPWSSTQSLMVTRSSASDFTVCPACIVLSPPVGNCLLVFIKVTVSQGVLYFRIDTDLRAPIYLQVDKVLLKFLGCIKTSLPRGRPLPARSETLVTADSNPFEWYPQTVPKLSPLVYGLTEPRHLTLPHDNCSITTGTK